MPTVAPDVYRIDQAADPEAEDVVSYYEYVPVMLQRHMGARPSRTSMHKYLERGFPVQRGGPYVRFPVFRRLKRPMTTVEAMERWLTVVRDLHDELGIVTG